MYRHFSLVDNNELEKAVAVQISDPFRLAGKLPAVEKNDTINGDGGIHI